MSYDKMNDFIETVYNVFIVTNKKANLNKTNCCEFIFDAFSTYHKCFNTER